MLKIFKKVLYLLILVHILVHKNLKSRTLIDAFSRFFIEEVNF